MGNRNSFLPLYYILIQCEEHCIDHIRQMLMCGGDMTPIPTVWTDKSQRNYVHSDVPHSCRDFSQLREFLAVRGPGGTDEPPASSLKKHQ